MNEIKQKFYLWLPTISNYADYLVLVLIALLCFYLYEPRVREDTESTINTIREQQQQLTVEIGTAIKQNQSARDAVESAGNRIDTASERIERVKELNQSSKDQLEAIRRELVQMQSLVSDNRAIFESIREADRPNP